MMHHTYLNTIVVVSFDITPQRGQYSQWVILKRSTNDFGLVFILNRILLNLIIIDGTLTSKKDIIMLQI